MKNKLVTFLAPITLLALGACATPFNADVSRFQELPAAQGQTFTIRAADVRDLDPLDLLVHVSRLVGAETSLRPFNTLEMVESETPASSAISASVMRSARVSVMCPPAGHSVWRGRNYRDLLASGRFLDMLVRATFVQ